ncbi:MAG: class F sortase [bacterium]|nr:class F sortase [bacterium]
MQLKILLRRILFVGGVLGLLFSLALSFYFLLQSSSTLLIQNTTALSVTALTGEEASFGLPASTVGRPVRLKIPKIGVDSVVEYVGLTSNGAMDVPKSRDNVAWFEIGQSPGENGSAVIAGHYGLENRKTSAFDNLHKLRQGDRLYIEDDKGVVISFVVRESRRYDPKADASAVFGSSDGKSHLNLVTCEGDWNDVSESYTKRLVVFTDKEE